MKTMMRMLALGAMSLGLLSTGCNPECVDQFDCANRHGNADPGKQFVCVANHCEQKDLGVADAGTPDAGTKPDAGTGMDAGTGTDGGSDAGVTCADLPHDAKLGTLQLQAGFTVAESVALADDISSVATRMSGSRYAVYGVSDPDQSLYSLGTWPDLATSTTPLKAIVPSGETGGPFFLSGFLATDGTWLLTGYTKSGAGFPGKVLAYDQGTPANSVYLSAPGNFTAAGVSGALLLNGLGLEGVAKTGAAIYALKTGGSSLVASQLATFPDSGAYSGFTAVATNGIAVFGDSVYPNNTLRAVTPAVYSPHVSDGTSFALTDDVAPSLYSGGELLGLASFGGAVALHNGTYSEGTRGVSRIPLTINGSDAKAVVIGTNQSVLTTSDKCTQVVLMSPLGPDLLLGVQDKNGRRLVHLQSTRP